MRRILHLDLCVDDEVVVNVGVQGELHVRLHLIRNHSTLMMNPFLFSIGKYKSAVRISTFEPLSRYLWIMPSWYFAMMLGSKVLMFS